MDQVYLNCNVNVCQTGGENFNECICQGNVNMDDYYYGNYYYANYMQQLYDNWKGDEEGGRKKRSVSGKFKRAAVETDNSYDEIDYDQEDIEVAEKEDISELIETSISWKIMEPLSAEEMIKMSEVSRSEYEVTPDEVIETIIEEMKEGKPLSPIINLKQIIINYFRRFANHNDYLNCINGCNHRIGSLHRSLRSMSSKIHGTEK